jgi:repressor LexA
MEEHDYCPSYDEIAGGLQLASLATVHKHIRALEAKNYLKHAHNRSRSLELAPKFFQDQRKLKEGVAHGARIQLAGRIAAGEPVEAVEGRETLDFSDFVGNSNTFALQVRGDSMIEDHICDGDYVLVERSTRVNNGDIVVALVGGTDTTLKRFYREPGDKVRLQPANTSMEPIIVAMENLLIQGRVLAVLRKYR